MKKLLFLAFLYLPIITTAATVREYQEAHCTGQIEVQTPERTRADCLTDTHAIEYDFAKK